MFEVRRGRRHDVSLGLAKMYSKPPGRSQWPAYGLHLDRATSEVTGLPLQIGRISSEKSLPLNHLAGVTWRE